MHDLETVTDQLLQRQTVRTYSRVLNRRSKRSRRSTAESSSPVRLTGGMIVGFMLGLAIGQVIHFLYNVHKLANKLNVSVSLIFRAVKGVILQYFPDSLHAPPTSEST